MNVLNMFTNCYHFESLSTCLEPLNYQWGNSHHILRLCECLHLRNVADHQPIFWSPTSGALGFCAPAESGRGDGPLEFLLTSTEPRSLLVTSNRSGKSFLNSFTSSSRDGFVLEFTDEWRSFDHIDKNWNWLQFVISNSMLQITTL